MNVIPVNLVQRGAVLMAAAVHLEAPGMQLGSTTVTIDGEGRLLLFQTSGLFSTARIVELPRDQASLSIDGGVVEVRGGSIRLLRLELDPDSTFFRLLTGAPELGWEPLGLVDAVVLTLHPQDPRQPPQGRRLGHARSTTQLQRREDGSLRLDNPHEVVEIPASELLGIEPVEGDALAVVARLVRPGDVPAEPLVGVRIRSARAGVVEARAGATVKVAAAEVAGQLGGRAVDGALLLRTETDLEVLDAAGVRVGALALQSLRWIAPGPALLVQGERGSVTSALPEEHARWLMDELPQSPVPLVDVRLGEVRLGAGEVTVDGRVLHVSTSELRRLDLSHLDPALLVSEPGPLGSTLRIGSELVLDGSVQAVADLRRDIGGPMGMARVEGLGLGDLYREYHRLRTERWLGLVLGPIVLTERMLQEASSLPAEEGEDPERLERRRIVAETLIVAEQLRSVRLHLGVSAVALPYGLLDEEGDWLDALVGEDGSGAWLGKCRRRVLDTVRSQVRLVNMNVAFALSDTDRAVSRLDPIHHPPDQAGYKSMLGRIGLGAAMMLISPVSGTLTIASAVAGKVTDRVSKDGRGKVVVDRWGPLCRSSWGLLVDVTALSALETRGALNRLWADLAARDRALVEEGETSRERLREQLLDRIQVLRTQRLQSIPIEGETHADLAALLSERMAEAPWELVEGLTGR